MTWRRMARFICSSLIVFGLVQGIAFPQWGGPSNQAVGRQGAIQPFPSPQAVAPSSLLAVSIRKTNREDLPKIAAYLAAASTSLQHQQQQGGGIHVGFRARIDRMFAQDDIHKLLESRYRAIYECQRSWSRLARQLEAMNSSSSSSSSSSCSSSNNNENNKSSIDHGGNDHVDKSSLLLWRHWWTTSDRARAAIASAVAMTAEPTMFESGSTIDLTPQRYALQHVQLTAVPRQRGLGDETRRPANNNNNMMPIGFCEVAMEPPLGRPLILNVAVDPRYRRRGVARRLMRTAERFVRRHWKNGRQVVDPGIGLYVDLSNTAALELYKSLGYAIVDSRDAAATEDTELFVGPRDHHHQKGGRTMAYMFKSFSADNNARTGAKQQLTVPNNSVFTTR